MTFCLMWCLLQAAVKPVLPFADDSSQKLAKKPQTSEEHPIKVSSKKKRTIYLGHWSYRSNFLKTGSCQASNVKADELIFWILIIPLCKMMHQRWEFLFINNTLKHSVKNRWSHITSTAEWFLIKDPRDKRFEKWIQI